MKWLTHVLPAMLLFSLVLPLTLTAQDEKKEDKTDEKKEDPKKKEVKPLEAMPVFGSKMENVRLKKVESTDVFVESRQLDPKKVADFQKWYAQQKAGIRSIQQLQQFQQQAAQKQQGLYSMTPVNYRLAEKIKVRIMYPPKEYDDRGNIKTYSPKDLAILKGNTTMPGYRAAFDYLRDGHVVDLYFAKQAPMPKTTPKKDDELVIGGSNRPEVVLIVIKDEPPNPLGK